MTGDTTDGSLVDLPTTAVGLQLELVTAGGSNCETPRMLAVEPRLGRRDWEATFCIVLYSMQHAKLELRVKHTVNTQQYAKVLFLTINWWLLCMMV